MATGLAAPSRHLGAAESHSVTQRVSQWLEIRTGPMPVAQRGRRGEQGRPMKSASVDLLRCHHSAQEEAAC